MKKNDLWKIFESNFFTENKPVQAEKRSHICNFLQDNDYNICCICGKIENRLVDETDISNKYQILQSKYKRINHFNEVLNQFEGTETLYKPKKEIDMMLDVVDKNLKENNLEPNRHNVKE